MTGSQRTPGFGASHILLIGNDIPTLQNVKSWLGKCFSIKDLGEAAYILGIKIYRDRSKRLIGLSQSAYIDKVLKLFSMQDSKRGYLPMSHGITLSKSQCPNTKDEQERISKIPYASAIESIMYVMLCTKPDVSYALSITSRYQSDPGESHWTAVKNILKYLRRSKDMFLVYGGLEDDLVVNGYTDASFQSDKHILRHYHLIREIIERGDVKICRVPIDGNVADPLTKPLPQAKHDHHARFIGIRYIDEWA